MQGKNVKSMLNLLQYAIRAGSATRGAARSVVTAQSVVTLLRQE